MTEEYSQKEEDTFRKDLFKQLDRIESDGKETKAQAFRTNGRVTVVETTLKDYDDYKEIVQSLSGYKMWLAGTGATVLLLGSAIGYLFMQNVYQTNTENARQIIEQERAQIIKDASTEAVSELEEKYNLYDNK